MEMGGLLMHAIAVQQCFPSFRAEGRKTNSYEAAFKKSDADTHEMLPKICSALKGVQFQCR